jgi:hypothetical protein
MRRNVSGQAYALTVLTPILDGHVDALRQHLDALPEGPGSPLARVPGTHLGRWVVLEDLIHQGHGQRRDRWSASRLLFTSNFDGSRDPYLERLRTNLGDDADAIWGHCPGYPGHADATAFAGWLRAHELEAALFFAAYGAQTVEQVHANLDTRRRLIEFALEAQRLEPARLRSRFIDRFAKT